MKSLLLSLLLLTSCGSQMAARSAATNKRTLEEARNALHDVKMALAKQQLELDLLQEKVAGGKTETPYGPYAARIDTIEATQRRILEDLKKLTAHANETTSALNQFKKCIQTLEQELATQSNRLADVVQLKSTLNSISNAIGQKGRTHTVQSGDSLDRIARKYQTSVQEIRQANGLTSNTILVGQELKIP